MSHTTATPLNIQDKEQSTCIHFEHESHHEKTRFLHIRKQRRRSAAQ